MAKCITNMYTQEGHNEAGIIVVHLATSDCFAHLFDRNCYRHLAEWCQNKQVAPGCEKEHAHALV